MPEFGAMYATSAGTLAVTVPAAGTYARVNFPNASEATPGVTVDVSTDYALEIASNAGGYYFIASTLSFSGTNGVTIHGDVFVDATDCYIGFLRKLGSNDVGVVGMNGIVKLLGGEKITVKLTSSKSGGDTVTVEHGSLSVVRLQVL